VDPLECEVIVFDFDGVLAKEGLEPRPLGVELLKRALEMGFLVYIVSGRGRAEADTVKSFLREIGVNLQRVSFLLRPSHAYSEREWKLQAYERILEKHGCIMEIHDGNPYVLYSARRLNVRTLVLHYDNFCETIRGRTILGKC
jgi:hydroxymethylpyrimidine pyrophosphatase-like HAD family hydrolase